MNKKLPVIIIILLLSFMIFLLFKPQNAFVGLKIKNEKTYFLNSEKMNGSDRYQMKLRKGDSLKVIFILEKGNINVDIKSSDGTIIYSGNGKDMNNFTLNIDNEDTYTITVVAKNFRGSILVEIVDKN